MMARLQILIVAVLLTVAVGSTKLRDAAQTTDPITAPTTARTAASTSMSDSSVDDECKVEWDGRGMELFLNFVGKYYAKPGTDAANLPPEAKVSIFLFFSIKIFLI